MQWTQSNLFEEGFIAMLPTDLYNGADIPFNAIAGSIIMTCNVWIKILTDKGVSHKLNMHIPDK